MSSAVVRPATAPDAPGLAALAERTFRDTYAAQNRPDDIDRYVTEHFGASLQAAELRDETIVTLVAEMEGTVAGYAQLARREGPPCVVGLDGIEIARFYVDRRWHGRGLAHRLMASAADAARALGARALWLGVWENNPRAIAFYRKVGFQDVGTQVFVLGAAHQRDLVLVRPLV